MKDVLQEQARVLVKEILSIEKWRRNLFDHFGHTDYVYTPFEESLSIHEDHLNDLGINWKDLLPLMSLELIESDEKGYLF